MMGMGARKGLDWRGLRTDKEASMGSNFSKAELTRLSDIALASIFNRVNKRNPKSRQDHAALQDVRREVTRRLRPRTP